jgi:UDP-glucuronate 4-epimerase
MNMRIFVTGTAGFIGFHLAQRLLEDGHTVVGLDNMNHYYDVQLKRDRLEKLNEQEQFTFYERDLVDLPALESIFNMYHFDLVFNLAAQAGVRYSLENPHTYIQSNIVGFTNLLEVCRQHEISHLIYASSSSVYGANVKMPFSATDPVDHPVSLYAATKKSNELLAHTYSHLYRLPTTGLRFFTVYGPWGRPDMAYFSFTRKIISGEPIHVYNHGHMKRDFTYIDDIVEAMVRLMDRAPQPNPLWDGEHPHPASSYAPYRVYNLGNNKPVELMTFIRTLENKLQKEALIQFLPMQPGDVQETFADISGLQEEIGYQPTTTIDEGLGQFVNWYEVYYDKAVIHI